MFHSIPQGIQRIMSRYLDFNKIPISYSIVQALIEHRELAPDDVIVRWTQEQELIFESTLGEFEGDEVITQGENKMAAPG